MSKYRAVRSALADGGVELLIRRTRIWAAGRIYPGTIPSPPKAKRPGDARRAGKRPAKAPVSTASDVSHADALAWFEQRRDKYERLAQAVAPHIVRDGVIYDIGANIGYFTKVLAEQTGFRGKAHLFEPIPNLTKLCAETLRDAPFDVHIHEYGLGNADATLDIYVGVGNLGWNTMVSDKAHSNMDRLQVAVKDFNKTGISDVPSFIKIDVEGAEHLVFGGLIESLATWPTKPVILCEIGWGVTHPQWDEELAAFADLAAIGYQAVDLDGAVVDLTTLNKTTDVIFLPS